MSHTLKKLTLALISATAVMAHAGDKLGPYSPVTDSRLQNPEPQNWLQVSTSVSLVGRATRVAQTR